MKNYYKKAAVAHLTKTAALEYMKNGIRVNAVAPTTTRTELVDAFWNSSRNKDNKEHIHRSFSYCNPMYAEFGELLECDDVTGAVSFLVGPDAKFITGHTLPIDGGYSAQ